MTISIDYNGISYQNYDYDVLAGLLGKDVVDTILLDNKMGENVMLRKQAYVAEADPLYLEWQYDNTSEKEQQWRDKVLEIKTRYPLR